MKKRILWLALDTIAAALILLAVWIVDYKLPQKGIRAAAFEETLEAADARESSSADANVGGSTAANAGAGGAGTDNGAEAGANAGAGNGVEAGADVGIDGATEEQWEQQGMLQSTNVVRDTQDWHQKFADKFTDTVVATDTSYTSPDLSIQLTYNQYDTGKLDKSGSGKHEKYGTQISYVLADIYVGDITCLRTAFAQDTYGVGYSEKLSGMSDRMKAVLAVNGDSYSNNRHRNNGTIIRNGVIYRSQATDAETCVLNWDGTMDIYTPDQMDIQKLIERGAYQSWVFGPSLLDENGKAKDSFLTWDYIRQSHPRTAIGYYEPGHYCLLLVDGRQKASRGMFLDEMAQLFEELGCKAAYNLDGGHCSFMNFQGRRKPSL